MEEGRWNPNIFGEWSLQGEKARREKEFVLRTGRFDNIDPAVIISSVCKAVRLMMTASAVARANEVVGHKPKVRGH